MIEPQFKQNQNIWEIDVPGDNSCLFWAVALACLIPVKDNDYVFETRFKKLFGKGSLLKLASVKNWIRSYNPFSMEVTDDTLGKLIRQQLHQRVIDHMGAPRNRDRFAYHIAPIEGDTNDYLSRMKDASTWGGEPEIRAMSELLDCRIQVTEDGVDLPPYGVGTPIQLFHVGKPNPNHYRFGLEKSMGDDYQSTIKSVATSEHKAASTFVKRLGTEEEPPHKKARNDVQVSRAVIQEPQFKQPDTEKDIPKPPVETNINVIGVSGTGIVVQADKIKVIGTKITYKTQQDSYTAYFSEVEKYNIDFKKDIIELKLFLEGKNQVLHLFFTGKDTMLGYITVGILFKKIKQETYPKAKKTAVEEQIYNYTKTNGLRVASLDWLLQKDEVLDDFKNPENNLLVINCTSSPRTDKADKKFRKLFDVLKQRPTKKVIFIGVEDKKQAGISSSIRTFFKKKLGEHYTEKDGDDIKFSDLTDGSEYKVLEKEIVFQGQRMPLSQLMGIEDPDNLSQNELDKLNKVLDSAAILELITHTGIEIGSAPPGWHDQDTFLDKETYITRSFNRRITYVDKVLTKNVGDLFAVGDIAEADFKKLILENEAIQLLNLQKPNIDPHKRFILLDGRTQNYQDQEEAFNKLCSSLQENQKDKVIHWLKIEKEELVWQRTWSQSKTYVYDAGASKEADTESAPSETTEVPDKIVVVIDEPGMGKSTTLTHVSEHVRNDNKWAIRINLKDHQETIENHLVQNDQALLDLLAAIDTQGLKATLARRVLAYRLQQQDKIVLLLDGYDEISSNCQDKVVQLLQFLKNERRAEKVWITARLHMKTKLEDALSVFSFRFKPFNTADQQRFLKRFWTKRLISEDQSVEGTIHEDCLVYYAGKLINQFSSPKSTAIKKTKTLGEVIGIPLLTRMLAEIFFNDLKSFYDLNKGNMEFALGSESKLRTLNILELYEEFIKAKYDIYFKEKISIDRKVDLGEKQILMDGYTKTHQYLAFNTLFSEQIESFLETKKDPLSNDKLAAIGIIKDFKSHVPHFIHPTFAEYFVADLLYIHLSEDRQHLVKYAAVKEFLQLQLFKDKNTMIRLFLDYKLAKSLPMHMTAINDEKEKLVTLLQKDAATRQLDSLKRTPLHLAAAYGYKTIIKALLIYQAGSMYIADELGEYPLSYAVLSRDQEVFRLILSKGRFDSTLIQASTMILLSTIQMVIQRCETGMLELVLSGAYVHRRHVAVMLAANNYEAFGQAVQVGNYSGIKMMESLWAKADEKQQKEMWSSIDAVATFGQVVKSSDNFASEMIDCLWAKADEKQQKEMWTSIDAVAAFQKAVKRGDYKGSKMMNSLWGKADEKQQKEIWHTINAVAAFQQAVQSDHYWIMDSLWTKADEKQQKEMWNTIDALAPFRQAVKTGDSSMMDSLLAKANEKQQKEMWHTIDAVAPFVQAVKTGDSSMMDILFAKADEKQQKEMWNSVDAVAAFQKAVKRGDHFASNMTDSLWAKADEKQQKEMWNSIDAVAAFQQAVQRGDDEGSKMIDSLWAKADEKQQNEMWNSVDAVEAFQKAVESDRFWIMESLWAKADVKQQKEMWNSIDTVAAFQKAVESSDHFSYNLTDSLWAKADEKQQKEMWNSIDAVAAFQKAVQRGDNKGSKMMYSLWEKASTTEQQQAMWNSIDAVAAFQKAVKRGDYKCSEMMESLWEKAEEEQQQVMWNSIDAVAAFQKTVKSDNSRMMESLWAKADEKQQHEMWTSIDALEAFQKAVESDRFLIMESLWAKANVKQQKEMWNSTDTVAAFQNAIKRGYYNGSDMMYSLWAKADEKQQKEMWSSIDAVAAFGQAVKSSNHFASEMTDCLWAKADEKQQKEMWTSIDVVAAFQKAVKRGDYKGSEMMDSLWSKADEKQQKEMWNSIDAVAAFQKAVKRGDYKGSEMMYSLWEKASTTEQQQAMWNSIDAVAAFQKAVKRGDYKCSEMMYSLWEKASTKEQQQVMWNSIDAVAAFQKAVKSSDHFAFEMTNSLWAKADEKQQKEMWNSIDAVAAFQKAIKSSDIFAFEMTDSLWAKADEKQQKEMWNSIDAVEAFQKAVKSGDYKGSKMMDSIWAKADEEQQKEMWNSINAVAAFQKGVKSGDYKGSKMMDSSWAKADEKQQEKMWTSIDAVAAFRQAVKSSDNFASDMIDSLWAKADEKRKKQMWNSIDAVAAFKQAVQSDYYRMACMLLDKAMPEQWQVMWLNIDQAAFVHSRCRRNCNTPLHIAAELGYLALVRLLLNNGANINATNHSKMTALHVAAREGRLEISKALLDHVKDPKTLKELISRPDVEWQTALQLATQHKHLETAKLIQDHYIN